MKRVKNILRLTGTAMILASIALGQTPTATSTPSRSKASSENWQTDPTAFVHLLMGDDLSLQPSAAGKDSVPVADAVRKQVIGARVTWSVVRRANPLGVGPKTLPTAAIRQGNQLTGVLILMTRRVAEDTEVCEAPYQKTAIDEPVEISGKIASFMAGVRPDGNLVVVVTVTDAAGCQANAASGPGTTATASPGQIDLTGNWVWTRSGGRSREIAGTLELKRTPECDQADFVCFSGIARYDVDKDGKLNEEPCKFGIKKGGKDVVLLMKGFDGVGTVSDSGEIVIENNFLSFSLGTIRASRIKDKNK